MISSHTPPGTSIVCTGCQCNSDCHRPLVVRRTYVLAGWFDSWYLLLRGVPGELFSRRLFDLAVLPPSITETLNAAPIPTDAMVPVN